jgi:hypothetical protein
MVNHDLGIAAFAVNLGSSHVTPLRGTRSENGDRGAHEAVGHQYLDQLAVKSQEVVCGVVHPDQLRESGGCQAITDTPRGGPDEHP